MRFEFVAIDPLTCQVIWQPPSSRHHISFHPLVIHVIRKFPLKFFSNAKKQNISEKKENTWKYTQSTYDLNISSHLVQSPRLQLSDGIRKGIFWQGNNNGKLHKMIDGLDKLNIDSADVFCGTS